MRTVNQRTIHSGIHSVLLLFLRLVDWWYRSQMEMRVIFITPAPRDRLHLWNSKGFPLRTTRPYPTSVMPRQFSYVVQRADLWPLLCRPNDDFTIRAPVAGEREIISIVLKIKRVSSIAGGFRGNFERGTKNWWFWEGKVLDVLVKIYFTQRCDWRRFVRKSLITLIEFVAGTVLSSTCNRLSTPFWYQLTLLRTEVPY